MRIHHFVLLFCVFAVSAIVITDISISEKRMVTENIRKIDDALEKATVTATKCLGGYMGKNDPTVNREAATKAFFDSMAADFGTADNPVQKKMLEQYTPIIMVSDNEGFWIYYYDTRIINGYSEQVRYWSPKKYYTCRDVPEKTNSRGTGFIIKFTGIHSCLCCDIEGIAGTKGAVYKVYTDSLRDSSDGTEYILGDLHIDKKMNYDSILFDSQRFEEKRKNTIAEMMEQYLTYYCNRYNRYGALTGEKYVFTIPAADSSLYLRAADGASFWAFFQGYPIEGTDEVFNRFTLSDTQLISADIYMIDSGGYYHNEYCTKTYEITGVCGSKRECAENGAFPCECCR